MEEISIIGNSFDAMCRLCLSNDLERIDIFTFSSSMRKQIADVIMKCAPIQITQRDEMPKFICRLCYSQLEKNHQFQMQAVQSDKILRRYIQKFHASDQTKPDCSNQKSSDDPLIHEIVVKCEPSELYDMSETDLNWKEKELPGMNSENKINDESTFNLCLNSMDYTDFSKDDDNNIGADVDSSKMIVNWKEKVPPKNNETLFLKSEIEDGLLDDSHIFTDVDVGNTINDSSNARKNEVGHTSGNFVWIRSDITEYCQKEGLKNTLANCENNKKTKTDKKRYACDICSTSFTRSSQLKNHKLKHTGEKQCQCDICNKCFVTIGQLKIHHKRVHTDEKPYQCDVCNKRFNESCNLERHKRTHTGEKRYQCDLCNKSFPRSDSLIVHKRTHTGEKQYQCDICNKCFNTSGELGKHKRIH